MPKKPRAPNPHSPKVCEVFVGVREGARLAGVSASAIRSWRQQGLISPNENNKYSLAELEAIKGSMGEGNRADNKVRGGDALTSMAAKDAQRARLVPNENGDDVDIETGVSIRALTIWRAQARYSKDAMDALKTAGKLVSVPHAAELYRRFIKEVKGRVQGMPSHYSARLTERGLSPVEANAFLEEVASDILQEIADADLPVKFLHELEDEPK